MEDKNLEQLKEAALQSATEGVEVEITESGERRVAEAPVGAPIPLNREQRRKRDRIEAKATKKGLKKQESKMVDTMQTPATIGEVVQIATSVANDVINGYHQQANPLIVSMSLHIEIIKKKLVENNLVTEEEFDNLFEESVSEFNRLRDEKLNSSQSGEVATSADVPSSTDVAEATSPEPEASK